MRVFRLLGASFRVYTHVSDHHVRANPQHLVDRLRKFVAVSGPVEAGHGPLVIESQHQRTVAERLRNRVPRQDCAHQPALSGECVENVRPASADRIDFVVASVRSWFRLALRFRVLLWLWLALRFFPPRWCSLTARLRLLLGLGLVPSARLLLRFRLSLRL